MESLYHKAVHTLRLVDPDTCTCRKAAVFVHRGTRAGNMPVMFLAVTRNSGPQYRPENAKIMVRIATPQKGTRNFGKPPIQARVAVPAPIHAAIREQWGRRRHSAILCLEMVRYALVKKLSYPLVEIPELHH